MYDDFGSPKLTATFGYFVEFSLASSRDQNLGVRACQAVCNLSAYSIAGPAYYHSLLCVCLLHRHDTDWWSEMRRRLGAVQLTSSSWTETGRPGP